MTPPTASTILLRRRTLYLGLGLCIGLGSLVGLVLHQLLAPYLPATDSVGQAQQQLREHYVNELGTAELEQAALTGMTSRLDEYSELLSPRAYARLLDDARGQFAGIGIAVGLREGYFTVLRVFPNSPAAVGQVQSGDRITSVDDQSVKGWLLTELVDQLRGPIGSRVELQLRRATTTSANSDIDEVSSIIAVSLVRAQVTGAYLQARLLNGQVGYVQAAQCYDGLATDIYDAIGGLSDQPLQGLVLDLRDNPGGTLGCAVATVDLFLDSEIVVTTQNNRIAAQHSYHASSATPLRELPLSVIVNAGTASAAEIIAGALQDHNRATVIGSQTFAKGTVQTLLPPLANGSVLKITSARYLTPAGRSFDQEGLLPNKVISTNDEQAIIAMAVAALERQGEDQKEKAGEEEGKEAHALE